MLRDEKKKSSFFCQIQQILQSLCASSNLLKCRISACESDCKPSGSCSSLLVTNVHELTHAYSDHCNVTKTKIALSYFQVYKTRHFKTVGHFCLEVPSVWVSLSSPVCRNCCSSRQICSSSARLNALHGFFYYFQWFFKDAACTKQIHLEVFTDLEPKLIAGLSYSVVNGF